MGHGGDALVKRVYGHLGQVRHRSDVVEYRANQQLAQLEAEAKAVEADARRRTEAQHRRATATAYRDRVQGLRTVVSAEVPKY